MAHRPRPHPRIAATASTRRVPRSSATGARPRGAVRPQHQPGAATSPDRTSSAQSSAPTSATIPPSRRIECSPCRNASRPAQQHGLAAVDAPEQPERDEVGERRVADGAPDLRRRGERLGALVDEVLEDRAERGDAGRDADLAERRVDAARHARPCRLHDTDGAARDRGVRETDAGARDEEARQQDGPLVARLQPRMSSRPMPTSVRPTPVSRPMFTRSDSRPLSGATANDTSVIGRNRRPASSGS